MNVVSVRSVVVRREPLLAVDEVDGEELGRRLLGELPRPRHALRRVSARPGAVELPEHHMAARTHATASPDDDKFLRSRAFFALTRCCPRSRSWSTRPG